VNASCPRTVLGEGVASRAGWRAYRSGRCRNGRGSAGGAARVSADGGGTTGGTAAAALFSSCSALPDGAMSADGAAAAVRSASLPSATVSSPGAQVLLLASLFLASALASSLLAADLDLPGPSRNATRRAASTTLIFSAAGAARFKPDHPIRCPQSQGPRAHRRLLLPRRAPVNRHSARHCPTSTSRGFLPWRLSDDSPVLVAASHMGPSSETLHNSRPFSNHFAVRLGLLAGELILDFMTSRTQSIKRSATGLKLRFLSVMIETGHGRTGKSTRNAFSP
jgi:hypothetical protein